MSFLSNFFGDFFQYSFLRWATLSTCLIALGTGALSPLVVGNRLSFMGSAIAHSTLLAVGLAYLMVGTQSWGVLYATTLALVAVMGLLLSWWNSRRHLPSDGVIGIFLAGSLALGLIVHQKFLLGTTDLQALLMGDLLLASAEDLIPLVLVVFIILIIGLRWFHTWVYWAFDPVGASLAGVSMAFMRSVLYLSICALVVSVVKMAGVLALEGLLIIPGMVGLQTGKSMKQAWAHSMLFALISAPPALVLAYGLNLPTAPGLVIFQIILALIIISAFSSRNSAA